MPSFGKQMRQISLQFVPTAILSRQVAMIRESADHAALILNLPSQPKSIKETLEGLKDGDGKQKVSGIFAAVPYYIDLIGGPYIETNEAVCKAFRPKSAIKPAVEQHLNQLNAHLLYVTPWPPIRHLVGDAADQPGILASAADPHLRRE